MLNLRTWYEHGTAMVRTYMDKYQLLQAIKMIKYES
jgi:hypothetical protein